MASGPRSCWAGRASATASRCACSWPGCSRSCVRNKPEYAGAGTLPLLYFIAAGLLALAVAVETYFANDRWPLLAAAAVVGRHAAQPGPHGDDDAAGAGLRGRPGDRRPDRHALPAELRLLTPFLNITGAFALILGAIFSTYVFMPKRRVLAYSLDPNQPGDEFLFNLLIAPVAIIVNLVASLPGRGRAPCSAGRLHSRVPATILIAIGAFVATLGDTLNRFGMTEWFQLGKFLGVLFLFAGFLVSIEVFREIRVPFTSIRLGAARGPSRRRRSGPGRRRRGRRPGGSDRPRRHARRPTPGRPSPPVGRPYHGPDACRPTRPPVAGVAIVLTAASLFGTLGPLSRFAYDAGMQPLAFVAWRGGDRVPRHRGRSSPGGSGRRGGRLTRLGDLDRGARLSLGDRGA